MPGASIGSVRRLDFLVIGAGKSGTTWIWQFMRSHPQVFVPDDKELNYFNSEPIEPAGNRNPNYGKPLDWYERFFLEAAPEAVVGELSPAYLWSETAPAEIGRYNADIKLIAVLRQPVDRTFSHHLYRLQRGYVAPGLSFERALEDAPFLIERSMYGKHLARYLDVFDRDQLKVLFYEDLKEDSRSFADQITDFLGVDPGLLPVPGRVNRSGVPVSPRLNHLLTKIDLYTHGRPWLTRLRERLRNGRLFAMLKARLDRTVPFEVRPTVDPATRERLMAAFEPDIQRLEALLDVSLPQWRI